MFLAWGLGPLFGIFIARFLKKILGVWWYRLHLGIHLIITGLLSFIGVLIVGLYKAPPHFDSVHTKIGLAVVIIMAIQIVLGFVINALWDPNRTSIPLWDQAHWWIGRILWCLAIANIGLGLKEYDEFQPVSKAINALYWVFIALAVGAFIWGWYYYEYKQHHGKLYFIFFIYIEKRSRRNRVAKQFTK